MRNALLVGSTGMLSGLVPKLLQDHFEVFVIGRDSAKLDGLRQHAGVYQDRLTCMKLDYMQLEQVARWVAYIQLTHGPLDRVVAWVHGSSEPLLRTIGVEVEQYRQSPWDLYQVRGISASQEGPLVSLGLAHCRFHVITLGYVREQGVSRWLTHGEIVEGVYEALAMPGDSVVGVVAPYSDRPR